MKRILFTRDSPTAHSEAGLIVPGVNEIADDALAARLLEAGRATGDYLPVDDVGLEIQNDAAEPREGPPPRRIRKERGE